MKGRVGGGEGKGTGWERGKEMERERQGRKTNGSEQGQNMKGEGNETKGVWRERHKKKRGRTNNDLMKQGVPKKRTSVPSPFFSSLLWLVFSVVGRNTMRIQQFSPSLSRNLGRWAGSGYPHANICKYMHICSTASPSIPHPSRVIWVGGEYMHICSSASPSSSRLN